MTLITLHTNTRNMTSKLYDLPTYLQGNITNTKRGGSVCHINSMYIYGKLFDPYYARIVIFTTLLALNNEDPI